MKVGDLKKLLDKMQNDDMNVIVELSKRGESNLIDDFLYSTGKDTNGKDAFALLERHPKKIDVAVFDEQLRLGIPNEFIEFCTENYTSPKEVLHGFIADLLSLHNYINSPRADKLNRNGSDESDIAEQYFTRVGYQYRGQL